MTDYLELIKDVYRCGGINQMWMNRRYKPDGHYVYIDRSIYDRVISQRENLIFRILKEGVLNDEYDYSGIGKDDVVLDIGANVGTFTLRAACLSNNVTAIEPVMYEYLVDNCQLNPHLNIKHYPYALGDGRVHEVSWLNKRIEIETKTLTQLRSLCGGRIDFLKCDTEGAEWWIKPEELRGIRRLEMELHYWKDNPTPKFNPALLEYIKENYNVLRVPDQEQPTEVIHGVLVE